MFGKSNSELLTRLRVLLKNFMDNEGRIVQWPAKPKLKQFVVIYLALQFEKDKKYSEIEVNSILKNWHTFQDWTILRRELFERGFLGRTDDGKEYWLTDKAIILD